MKNHTINYALVESVGILKHMQFKQLMYANREIHTTELRYFHMQQLMQPMSERTHVLVVFGNSPAADDDDLNLS